MKGQRTIIFIGLNPSLANSVDNDRTLIRLINFCLKWDYKIIYVINLFALISNSPARLLESNDPLGKYNDLVTLELLGFWSGDDSCDLWLGWGDKGILNRRNCQVLRIIRDLAKLNLTETNPSKRVLCLGLSKKGNPRHPLYMPNDSLLEPFEQFEQ